MFSPSLYFPLVSPWLYKHHVLKIKPAVQTVNVRLCVCAYQCVSPSCAHMPALDAHRKTHTHTPTERQLHFRRRHTCSGDEPMCLRTTHSCMRTYSPARWAGKRVQILARCHGDVASFKWRGEVLWLPGGTEQSRAEALPQPACITSSSLAFSLSFRFCASPLFLSSLCLISSSQVLASVSFVLFSSVCLLDPSSQPQRIHKSHHQHSREPSLTWGQEPEGWGCCASGESRMSLPLIPFTPSSVISSCAACDALPSIHLYQRLAGVRQGPLRAAFICFSSSTPAAEDHITSASIRRTPGENEGVQR